MKYQPARRVYVEKSGPSIGLIFEMIDGPDISIVVNKETASTELLTGVYRLVFGHELWERKDPNSSDGSENQV